jgi:hypothetical protein
MLEPVEEQSLDAWFSGSWLGRWLPVEAALTSAAAPAELVGIAQRCASSLVAADLPPGVDAASVFLDSVCIDCGALILARRPRRAERWLAPGPNGPWSPLPPHSEHGPPSESDHRHTSGTDHESIRYYGLPGVGPWKGQCRGSLRDVIGRIPFLVAPGAPFPSLAVLNDVLAQGWAHAGMSGGVEWPPTQVSSAEYDALRRSFQEERTGAVFVEIPDEVETREELAEWWAAGCAAYPAFVRRRFDDLVAQADWPERLELWSAVLDHYDAILEAASAWVEIRRPIEPGAAVPMIPRRRLARRLVRGLLADLPQLPAGADVTSYLTGEVVGDELIATLVLTNDEAGDLVDELAADIRKRGMEATAHRPDS